MKVKLTASCIWNVDEPDKEIARNLIEEKPVDIILDYLEDALRGGEDYPTLKYLWKK